LAWAAGARQVARSSSAGTSGECFRRLLKAGRVALPAGPIAPVTHAVDPTPALAQARSRKRLITSHCEPAPGDRFTRLGQFVRVVPEIVPLISCERACVKTKFGPVVGQSKLSPISGPTASAHRGQQVCNQTLHSRSSSSGSPSMSRRGFTSAGAAASAAPCPMERSVTASHPFLTAGHGHPPVGSRFPIENFENDPLSTMNLQTRARIPARSRSECSKSFDVFPLAIRSFFLTRSMVAMFVSQSDLTQGCPKTRLILPCFASLRDFFPS
jgi:hypothetical protein